MPGPSKDTARNLERAVKATTKNLPKSIKAAANRGKGKPNS